MVRFLPCSTALGAHIGADRYPSVNTLFYLFRCVSAKREAGKLTKKSIAPSWGAAVLHPYNVDTVSQDAGKGRRTTRTPPFATGWGDVTDKSRGLSGGYRVGGNDSLWRFFRGAVRREIVG